MSSGRAHAHTTADPATGGPVTTLLVPLRAPGSAISDPCLVRHGGAAFSREAIRFAELCAVATAAAGRNAALYEQSQQLALTDPLTGLYNRLADADRTLYRAKAAGRNCVAVAEGPARRASAAVGSH